MSTTPPLDTFDDEVLAHLRAGLLSDGAQVEVHELRAPTQRGADGEDTVVTATLPYLVYSPGSRVLDGPRRVVGGGAKDRTFRLMFVGATRAQAVAVADRAHHWLHDQRVVAAGSRLWHQQRTEVRVEDTYVGAGNVDLVYGTDIYQHSP